MKALSLIALFAFALSTSAFANHHMKGEKGEFHCMRDKANPAMHQALEKGDFDAWKAEMDKDNKGCPAMKVITKENFGKFAEAHKLARDGKKEEAGKIFSSLGLDKPCAHAKDGSCPHSKDGKCSHGKGAGSNDCPHHKK